MKSFVVLVGLWVWLSAGLVSAKSTFAERLVEAAVERTQHAVVYDGTYVKLSYPGGDVPKDRGVCTDVVIRSYRVLGIDLQKLVHEDMRRAFGEYPNHWGLKKPDKNIDHRRVPNLRAFFRRHGQSLGKSKQAADFKPGDLVTWNVASGGWLPHIGVVIDKWSVDGNRPLIVHNIGAGPVIEDVLFAYDLTGHYRFEPKP
ncbi:MAG: DUF1287 domain-containing protein [Myxococcota bacterium]|nr:DUF1287 domain-containing protein [Myxococcota bacterium]